MGRGLVAILLASLNLGCSVVTSTQTEAPAQMAKVSSPPPANLSLERYSANVRVLSSDRMEGRRIGTTGGQRARTFMADGFRAAGLVPAPRIGGFEQSYIHEWWGRTRGANVIAVLPGRDPAFAREVVVVSAHHDHLGFKKSSGCPNDRTVRRLRPGANDNATGSAALLELAHAFGAASSDLRRTMVFLSTDGEECGCTGAKHYVYNNPAFPLADTVYVLNIDQIGKGGWLETHTRANSGRRDDDCEVDGEVFARMGVRAQTFVGNNPNYHSPADTIDKVDFRKAFALVERARDILWQRVQAIPL